MDNKKVKAEYKRLYSLLEAAEVPKKQIEVLHGVIDNLAWQRVKLDETRELMAQAQVVCKYDNGGGQSGIRENPLFKGYATLWRNYLMGLDKFTSYLPKEMQDEVKGAEVSALDNVLMMKKRSRKAAE